MNENRLKTIELGELVINNGKNGNALWVLIEGLVYDLTFFDHPGGIEVFDQDPDNYRDLSREFEYVDHSSKAKKLMKKFLVGKYIA